MLYINLTPHTVNIYDVDGEPLTEVQPSGEVARVTAFEKFSYGALGEIPVCSTEFGSVEGLPEPLDGTVFIVSGMVATHDEVKGRADVFSPGPLIRDDEGRPIGCRGLRKA